MNETVRVCVVCPAGPRGWIRGLRARGIVPVDVGVGAGVGAGAGVVTILLHASGCITVCELYRKILRWCGVELGPKASLGWP